MKQLMAGDERDSNAIVNINGADMSNAYNFFGMIAMDNKKNLAKSDLQRR